MSTTLKKLLTAKDSGLIVQFLRYAVVGGIAAVVDIGLYTIGTNVLGIHYIIANTLSFTIATFVNYFMSRNWVFNNNAGILTKDFLLFTIIGVIGIFISNFVLYILVDCKVIADLFPGLGQNYIKVCAKLVAVCIVLFWSFIGRKKIMKSN